MSIAAHLLGNAVGLLLAALLLDGFSIDALSFVIVVVIFTVIEVIASPLINKLSEKKVPALKGGIALVTTFVGLIVTEILISGFTIGGIANLLASTLLVWLGALAAGILIPMFLFKELREPKK
jgi:low temperature requirement protein LtrA|nr:phage holin family protein [Shimia thalassica]